MPVRESPTAWRELNLRHLFYAFRKAKADCFFERVVLVAEAFAEYEHNLFENLSRLLARLRADEVDAVLTENLGSPVIVAKKLSKIAKIERDSVQAHDFFSDPARFFQRLDASYYLIPEFRLVGQFPVEMHILSALWVNLVGHKFDAPLGAHAQGSRLRRYRPKAGDQPNTKGEFHLEALGTFEPYFTPYKNWRARGLAAIRSELLAKRDIVAISLDLANYYHRIDPNFIARRAFQSAIGVQLSLWEKRFTESFARALSSWADLVQSRLMSFGVKLGKSDLGGIPIGLSAARLMANVLLYRLDQEIIRGLTPVYYGRYVDDMFLVIHDPGDLHNAGALFDWIHKRVPVLEKANGQSETRVAFPPDYAGGSLITLQHAKQKVFFYPVL